jgi:hypothetical protein
MKIIEDVEHFKKIITERIKKNVTINENGCWIWNLGKHKQGYGKIVYWNGTERFHLNTHRAAWLAFKGEIPDGLIVLHKCPGDYQPACCNPDHMKLGTYKENKIDEIRQRHNGEYHINVGKEHPLSKLDEKKVLKIRKLHKTGISMKELANIYGVKYYTIVDVINRRNWKHI